MCRHVLSATATTEVKGLRFAQALDHAINNKPVRFPVRLQATGPRVAEVICIAAPPSRRYGRKLAVTDRAALMVTIQVVPETASQPLQPLKMERKPGVAVRVTTVPLL